MNYPDNIEEIKKFAEEIGIDVKYLLGEKWKGSLNLSSVKSLPPNIVFNVGGYLDLSSVKTMPDNIVFNVGDWLFLRDVQTLPFNVIFNVGGPLALRSVASLPSGTIFNVREEINFPTKHKVKVIWT